MSFSFVMEAPFEPTIPNVSHAEPSSSSPSQSSKGSRKFDKSRLAESSSGRLSGLGLHGVVRLKLFARKIRNKTVTHKNEERYWFIIMPSNRNKLKWDLLNFGLLIYSAFQIPFALSFQTSTCDISPTDIFDLVVDCLFLSDCILSCITAYTDSETGNPIVRPKAILAHYARTWLAPDLASSIPFDRIVCAVGVSDPHLARFVTMLRWLKILRLVKMVSA